MQFKLIGEDGIRYLWGKVKSRFVDKGGDTMSGTLDMGTNKIVLIDPYRVQDEDPETGSEATREGLELSATEKGENAGNGIALQLKTTTGLGKVVIAGVGDPQDSSDAATKNYVDKLVNIEYIIGILNDDGSLTLSSQAYNKSYTAIKDNKQIFIKLMTNDNIYILKGKTWENYNGHTNGQDAFYYVDNTDGTVVRTIKITSSENIYCENVLEKTDNKVQSVIKNYNVTTLYPSTSAVYDLVKPHVVYGGDDPTTGILAKQIGISELEDDSWQITGLDLTPYKRIKCYIASSTDSISTARLTPPVAIDVYLEEGFKPRTKGVDAYYGATTSYCTNDRNALYNVGVAVSSDKTKICFMNQSTLYGTTVGGRNDNGRYLYKIEAYYI